jgi:hypothetical protein
VQVFGYLDHLKEVVMAIDNDDVKGSGELEQQIRDQEWFRILTEQSVGKDGLRNPIIAQALREASIEAQRQRAAHTPVDS